MRGMGKKTFPHNARFTRVISILGVLNANSGTLGISKLSTISKTHVDMLLPQISAAVMLGLIKISGSCVTITDLGEALRRKRADSKAKVGKKLKTFEPFRSAASLAKKFGGFTSEELSEYLSDKDVYWHVGSQQNSLLINAMLVQWAIKFGLLSYDGKSKTWTSPV